MTRVLFAALLLAAPGAFAQGVGKHVLRLNMAPVSETVLRVQLPRPKEFKLPNGLTVLILERHDLPTVAFSLWLRSGAFSDPADRPGLASAVASMLREGTASRDSARLAAEIDEAGAALDASAAFGADVTKVSASGLADKADRILELMADVVLHPSLSSEELEKYKKRRLAQLEEQRSMPSFLAQERFVKALYGDFPASIIAPSSASVSALTSDELKAFHDRRYLPGTAILGVAGDVKADEMLASIKKAFGGWSGGSASAWSGAPGPAPSSLVLLVDRPGSVQTYIKAGDFSLKRTDPEFIPLTVMNRVLGEGPSGRLFLDLREEKGYTYGAYSGFGADIYKGSWGAALEVRNAVTDDAVRDLLADLGKLREEPVPAAELAEARRAIVARFALSLETPAGLLDYWMVSRYYGLPDDYWDKYPGEVMKVDAEAVQKAAKKYVDLPNLQIVCVGDAKTLEAPLRKYGPVQVYDPDGHRLR